LCIFPKNIRQWIRVVFAVVTYVVVLADVFCFVRFGATLNPTMLLLAGETTGKEASEFFSSYLSSDLFFSGCGWVLLIATMHACVALGLWHKLTKSFGLLMKRHLPSLTSRLSSLPSSLVTLIPYLLSIVLVILLIWAVLASWRNKVLMVEMFEKENIGQVEHELTKKEHAEFYLPLYRLVFSIFSNQLTDEQVEKLIAAKDKVRVDSCSYRSPHIVLIIGESYNKHHSQLYGYKKPTAPRQVARRRTGRLVSFSDVVAPWNLTSYVFKNMFSMHVVGQKGEWCDYPLFPEIFRKAGYHVTFLTNQFLPKAKEAVFDFSGGFFLNDPELSQRQFDTRNTRLYPYDEGLLKEYDKLAKEDTDHNLIILHLMGSHLMYKSRYPQKTRKYLTAKMYNRPELTNKQRMILADYDNSLRYNDSIVTTVTQRFMDKDAVVIYMPDHGEEMFDEKPYTYGRNHSANINKRLARYEMEIPFWIWGSPRYRENHPYGWQAIQNAKDRPMMVDALPHLLLYLAGISTPLYRADLNIISSEYNQKRPRILKGVTDYNELKK
jgi:heptose-I-phosphate ethanolaminephosphotransferase